jgi:glycosyltransferase involved in cell wall biosynthesis
MGRIHYLLMSREGGVAGGQKMAVRHVETLRELGFDAVCYVGVGSAMPTWFEHSAPAEPAKVLGPDDVIVIPDDAPEAMEMALKIGGRAVVFAQSREGFAALGFGPLSRFPPDRFPPILAVGPAHAATIGRAFPDARIELVPCFADERRFAPARTKKRVISLAPRKRRLEATAIRALLGRLHPRHAETTWYEMVNRTEADVARALGGSALHLSLGRLESVGLTTLEAMASGCVCVGFLGIGGRQYATPDNGFWVAEDDCEAAADALAGALDLVDGGGPRLAQMIEAARETARAWSHAAFRVRLEEAWMRLAPDARTLTT